MVSQITSFSIVCSTICWGTNQRKHQSSTSLASVRGILWWPVDSPAERPSSTENVSIGWCHHASMCQQMSNQLTGPWFNIKMSSYQYRKSHCGDKTVVRSSYLHNGISYTGKMSSLYWISPQCCYINRCSTIHAKFDLFYPKVELWITFNNVFFIT